MGIDLDRRQVTLKKGDPLESLRRSCLCHHGRRFSKLVSVAAAYRLRND